jgi:hypothetical protein
VKLKIWREILGYQYARTALTAMTTTAARSNVFVLLLIARLQELSCVAGLVTLFEASDISTLSTSLMETTSGT